jgi:hypothetical protein
VERIGWCGCFVEAVPGGGKECIGEEKLPGDVYADVEDVSEQEARADSESIVPPCGSCTVC